MSTRVKKIGLLGILLGILLGVVLVWAGIAVTLNKPTETAIQKEPVEQVDAEKEEILGMLESQGVDRAKLEEEYKTKNGATILGDALPVEKFKTLAEAEERYGDFLGLHNKLESLNEYSLVAMHLVNHEFIQATYESADETKTIVVKTSKVKTPTQLIAVYGDYTYKKQIDIQGINVSTSGESENKVQLMYFNTLDGKSYSLHTTYGLSEVEATKLLIELVSNLQLMGK